LPGAWHAVRADLPERLAALPSRPVTVLTSPDGVLAALAAAVFTASPVSMFAAFPAAVLVAVLAGANLDMGAELVEFL